MDKKATVRKKQKIPLRVTKGALIPADKFAEDDLRSKKYNIGDIVFGVITKPRNPKFNRLVHKIGVLCKQNIEGFESIETHAVIKRLQIESRVACDQIGIEVPGYLGLVYQWIPRSLSFESMDEAEFYEAAKGICNHISQRYWPSLSADEIENMAELMVD